MAVRFGALIDALKGARALIADRGDPSGGSPAYRYAAQEIARIDERLAHGPKPDRAFYMSLTQGIGLHCARELEASDPPFCTAVYALLEQIRLQTL